MTPEQNQPAYELFKQALEHPPEERGAFFAEACGDDAELRAEVLSLLEHDGQVTDGFMSPPEPDPALMTLGATRRSDGLIGSRVGSFQIRSLIASGGMGTVYEAVQERPHRLVALKIIKLGMDTREVVARFESEREALAMMNHPNIAKIFDAGATEEGRPYFVMEYVPGMRITKHCDLHRLDIEQRLELFMQVCNAIQHAHQKGIIHRDLKPSNILVAYEGQQAAPKIIDFGVAKALNQRLSEKTIFTEQGQLIGTPEYMSPEQAEMSGQDIDTRADVYSLGVLLYELLTGTLPFDSESLRRAAFGEIQRIIREVEPEKPSTKLSHLRTDRAGVAPAASDERVSETAAPVRDSSKPKAPAREPSSLDIVARNRRSDPRKLLRDLRGDLDWIVMKCLEKDRAQRYETANALAMEIRRYLNHEPVLAGAPSAAYRVRKFVRRNRGPMLAAGCVTFALVAGLIGTATFALRETQLRKVADENEQRARDNEALALERADETKQVAEFQASMLSGIDAEEMGQTILQELREQVKAGLERAGIIGEDDAMRERTADEVAAALLQFDEAVAPANLTDVARQMMDVSVLTPAAIAITGKFGEQPLVQAQLLDTLGPIYWSLGLYDLAEPHLRQALETRRRLLGDEHRDVATSLNNLAVLLHAKVQHAEAEPLYREALALRRKLLGDEHADTAQSLDNLAALLHAQGDYAAAEPLYREALALRRKLLGDEHADVAQSLNNLAQLLQDKADYATAEPLLREALALNRKLLGEEHRRVADALNNLAALLHAKGDRTAAEPLYRQALTVYRKRLGDQHPDVARALNNLAWLLENKGDYAAAEPLYREALALYRKLLGDQNLGVALTLNNLAGLLHAKGDRTAAEPLYRQALALYRKLLGDQHQSVALTRNNLATILRVKGDYAAAELLYREALEAFRTRLGEEHPDVAWTLTNLAVLRYVQGDFAAAEPLYRQALAIHEKKLPPAHSYTADSRVGLGRVLTDLGRYAEAEALLQEAQEYLTQTPTASRPLVGRTLKSLVKLYDAWHAAEPGDEGEHERGARAGKAAEWRAKLEDWRATTQPATPSRQPASQPTSADN